MWKMRYYCWTGETGQSVKVLMLLVEWIVLAPRHVRTQSWGQKDELYYGTQEPYGNRTCGERLEERIPVT
jgi:hypothetical protein